MLTINWDAVTGAAGYNFLIGFAPGSYIPGAFDMGNTTQIGPIDLSGGSGTFFMTVQAYSGSSKSSNSNEIAITIGSPSGLTAPQNFRYTLNGNTLTLQWDLAPGAAGYRIVLGTQPGNYIAGPVDTGNILQLPLNIAGVTGTYYLAAEAYNASKTSEYSNEIAVKLGSTNPQPFDSAGVTGTLFGALGQFYNPATTPLALTTIKNAYTTGGLNSVDTFLASTFPQVITKFPNGIQFTLLNQCSAQQVAGADTPETRVIDLGINHGTFQFDYNTYSQQDQIIVSYQGTILFDTGCVGASGTKYLSYSGTSTSVTADVHPNCAGGTGTAWNFTVYCP